MKNNRDLPENVHDFADQISNTKSDIQRCIKFLIKETNRNKYNYGQLRYIFRRVREECDIVVNDSKKSLYELPTKSQFDLFYSVIHNPIHKLMFEFLQGTGLRVSELCKLEVSRIDFDQNLIFIKEGKGKKDRVVPFGNKLKDKLKIYLSGRNNKYLFESNRNSAFTTRRIEQICKEYSETSNGESQICPHTFRHMYFTFLAENKISKELRMLIAGHKNEKTQDIYTHLAISGFKEELISIIDNK
jgi:site-specific recombinase XerD